MQATKANINELFTGTKVFDIPFYQRAYVWGEPQWERLLDDLEDISRSGVPHFIGSVILKQQSTSVINSHGDVRIVIDGQQRITTLAIFLKVLCLKNDNMKPFNNRFRLDDEDLTIRHNRNDKDAFEKIMNLNTLASIESGDRVSEAYEWFNKKMDISKLDINAILNSLLFVAIELSESEDEQQIFDTINSLGVRLSTPELLKNYFFSRDDERTYIEYWQVVFENDSETKNYWDITITTGGRERKFIELFFHAFLQIKIQELDIKGDEKKPFQTVDKLFDSYKKLIKDYADVTKKELLEEIKVFAEIFMEAFDTEILASELSTTAGRERINVLIFHMETTTLVPYVLFIERNIDDEQVKTELYECIESYIMRRVLTRENNRGYNMLFSDQLISNRILSKQSFLEFVTGQEATATRMPSDDEVVNAFNSSTLTNKYAAGVIYLIESKIRSSLHANKLLGVNKYSLEHIMPKKWENKWDFDGENEERAERNRALLTLGNLTIITQALNATIRDESWLVKRDGKNDKDNGLKHYSIGIDVLREYIDRDVWDESVIKERAGWLSRKALNIWKSN